MSDGMQWIVRFELPNGGPGPATVASDDLAAEFDAVVVLLLRDHYCQVSRDRAGAYSDAFDEFAAADIGVVGALPDTEERAAYWRDRYDLSYPVLTDSAEGASAAADDTGTATAMTDGTPRFDALSDVEVGVDSLPGIGVLDTRSTFPRLVYTEGGETLQDCPSPDEALDAALGVLGE